MFFFRNQRGLAMASVLLMVFVLAVISALVLYLSGKEIALTAVRRMGAQSLYIAEGGAASTRSAVMALMNADPIGAASIDPGLTSATLSNWYAGGVAASQNPYALFDYIVVDGQRYNLNPNPTTGAITLHVNWSLPDPHRKLLPGSGMPPNNSLGGGTYAAQVQITKRAVAHASCPGLPCYVHQLGPDDYELFFTYTVTSDGQMPPRARRRVTLSQDFSVRVRHQSFAEFVLFRDITTTPGGAPIWFIDRDFLDGPVHTNTQWRFVRFPRFTGRVTQVNNQAWFFNNGNPRQLAQNENVVAGVRRDAPVQPDGTPGNLADDVDNPPANFTRGVAPILIPDNPYSQKGVSVGRNPADTTEVTNLQIRQAVPELPDDSTAVPNGIYIPVLDSNGNGVSDPGEPLAGGIYVQGDLNSLLLGDNSNNGYYELRQGGQTVQIEVNRLAGTITVTNSAWPPPTTRTFLGVPKGWQALGSNPNAAIIYVQGNINSLQGMLEEKEQTTIAASGLIDITGNIVYEDPPDYTDPNDNPLNVLGIYAANNHVRMAASAPDDLTIHAVIMAGNRSDGFNSSFNAQNYNTRNIGTLHLIGGIIEEYSGPIGTMNGSGQQLSGYARDIHYDRRMSRGFSPPYFPTTTLFEMVSGSEPLAGVRPIWREASP